MESGLEDPADCTFDVAYELSSAIASVGIVTWSTDLPGMDTAYIDFGKDTNYGLRAPVDLREPELRTLLLGMAESSEYHFRITAMAGTTGCESEDFVLETGAAPNSLLRADFEVEMPDAVMPGFIVTSIYSMGDVVIYNAEGEIVWWYETPIAGLSRAGMTHDGKWMVARNANPIGSNSAEVSRVTMDGLTEESLDIANGHHDFTTTPDNDLVFIVRPRGSGCDEIVKLSEDGTLTSIFDVGSAFDDLPQQGDPCHSNAIQYNDFDDSYTLSVLNQDAYLKFSSDGTLLWKLGGSESQFTGDGASWSRQHGHHLVDASHLLFFNNDGAGAGGSSLAVEVDLDESAMTATRVWWYDGGLGSSTLGDVRRLENGNTLVTYSNAGLIHEVDPDGEVVQVISWSLGGAIGYVTHRASLYSGS